MSGENGEHRLLIFTTQVKEAVPCQNALKSPTQFQGSHICDDPLLIGKTTPGQFDERGSRIDACDVETLIDEIACNGFGRPTAEVKDRTPGGQETEKSVQHRLFEQMAAPLPIKRRGVALVKADNPLRLRTHRVTLASARSRSNREARYCRLLLHIAARFSTLVNLRY